MTLSPLSLRVPTVATVAADGVWQDLPVASVYGPYKSAAVLVALTFVDNEWQVVYIRRSECEGDRHSGQVAFPGGRVESGDASLEAAALREAYEEIGLRADDVQVLGRLNDYLTISNFRVTPVVGVFRSPYTYVLDAREVARVFTIPLAWLANPAHYEWRSRNDRSSRQDRQVVYFRPYDGEVLWGATARMSLQLVKHLIVG